MAFFNQAPIFWNKKKVPFFIGCLMGPLSLLYGSLFWLKQTIFQNKNKSPIPVICVGNIAMGGTGKTPTAIALYELIHKKYPEIKVHFVTRGYGGKNKGPVQVDREKHTFSDVGDEALLLAQYAPTWVARKRLKGIKEAAKKGANLVILDDGLQNPFIPKDFSLVVLDGKRGLSNGQVFPLGPLRETFKSVSKKADCFLVVGKGGDSLIQKLKTTQKEIIEAFFVPLKENITRVKEKKIIAFAGIGDPDKFFHMLEEEGLSVSTTKAFPDHHPYQEREIQALLEEAAKKGALCVTTEKDKVRIPQKYHKDIETISVQLKGLEKNKEFCIKIGQFLKEKKLIKEAL